MGATPVLNTLSLDELYAHFSRTGLVRRLIELARDEDLGAPRKREGHARDAHAAAGDITTRACIDPARRGVGNVVAREGGVIAGLAVVPELLSVFAPGCAWSARVKDGAVAQAGATIAAISGPLDEILETERTLLNVVGRLSGVATRTAAFVSRIPPGSRARLFDTRKTTPGLRVLEKYAVRCGGGFCHRIGLHDAVLIKDNHLAGVKLGDLAGFVRAAAERARAQDEPAFIEVEVDSLEQFGALLGLPAGVLDAVLLDNMSIAEMRRAREMRDGRNPGLALEASGGVTPETIGAIAETGVDRISVGGLTHAAISLDIALDISA